MRRSRAAAAACIVASGFAQTAAQQPLVQMRYPWPYSGPYQVDTTNGPRGIMTGYNRCNSTNAGQNSLCVNAVVNDITDFCFYAPPEPDSIIANVEGECVAWCNTAKYNTRVIPAGAVTGMQVIRTPGYIAMGLNVNGPLLNTQASDAGGELDPHGADNRGNPIGALMYTNAFQGGNANGETQAYEWHEFISGSLICLKVCNPNNGDVQGNNNLCDNVHDTIGCNANIPLNYNAIGSDFVQCLGENQLPPSQNLGASIFTPASSSCTTYTSSVIFAAAPTPSSSVVSSSASLSSGASSGASSSSAPTSAPSSSSASSGSGSVMPSLLASPSRASGMAVPTHAPVYVGAAVAAAAAYAFAA